MLVPIGLLLQVAAPIAQPFVDEANKAMANISYQATKDLPDNPFGNGGWSRKQKPDFAHQMEIEAARLQQQFGPQLNELSRLGLGILDTAVALTYSVVARSPARQQKLRADSWLRPENKKWHSDYKAKATQESATRVEESATK